MTVELTWQDVSTLAAEAAPLVPRNSKVYAIPNGGIPATLLLLEHRPLWLAEVPQDADLFFDDIIDSGATRDRYRSQFDKPFIALVDKQGTHKKWAGQWVSFPWERMTKQDGPQDNVRRLLEYIGEDPNREGLRETPDRVVRSYGELFAGYGQDPAEVFKTFESDGYDEMVVLRSVEVASTCEHHMLPFLGRAHVAYIPDGRVIGLSKLARLVEVFARRLQVQERLTKQVTAALDEYLKPKGSACVIEAKHLCVACRGVQKQHSVMITSSLTGVFRQPEVRAEFLSLVGERG